MSWIRKCSNCGKIEGDSVIFDNKPLQLKIRNYKGEYLEILNNINVFKTKNIDKYIELQRKMNDGMTEILPFDYDTKTPSREHIYIDQIQNGDSCQICNKCKNALLKLIRSYGKYNEMPEF